MTRPRKGRRRGAAGRQPPRDVEAEIAALAAMSVAQLRKTWSEKLGTAVPSLRSRDLLLRTLAWNLQAQARGGLDAVTAKRLSQIARAIERDGRYDPRTRRDLSPGVVLTREWKGVIHSVAVVADGFRHGGKLYRSLSDVARTITGTRWSGPRFFGLEQRARRGRERSALDDSAPSMADDHCKSHEPLPGYGGPTASDPAEHAS